MSECLNVRIFECFYKAFSIDRCTIYKAELYGCSGGWSPTRNDSSLNDMQNKQQECPANEIPRMPIDGIRCSMKDRQCPWKPGRIRLARQRVVARAGQPPAP